MTAERENLEARLSQGLKIWAAAGRPSRDLEAWVRAQTGEAAATEPVPPSPAAPRRRRWARWLQATAAAAALVLALGYTFPAWAGAAAGLPVVGPVITEIILRDAGLKWAYEAGLMQAPVAEARVGDATVRILAVAADPIRTTVIYQVTGLPEPPPDAGRPARPGSLFFSRPAPTYPGVSIRKVAGQGMASSQPMPLWTPLGVVGTVSTGPLTTPEAELEVGVEWQGETATLTFTASRAESSRLSRQLPVGVSQTIGGVTITVDSVIHTPAETLVEYRIRKEPFSGGVGFANREGSSYLETADGPVYSTHSTGSWYRPSEVTARESFPTSGGPARLVIPLQVVGAPAELVWELRAGAVAEAEGTPVTLETWERDGHRIAVQWSHAPRQRLAGFAEYSIVAADGTVHPLKVISEGWGTGGPRVMRSVDGELPPGVEPVAIRASRVGLRVEGPWTFDLPW